RNSESHHTARYRILLEYDWAVSLDRKEVCAGHSCRTGTDDGDLLVKLLSCGGNHRWHVSVLCFEILSCDKLLDVINSKRLVDASSCTFVLAVFAADSSADCRERVVFLNKLE